MGWWVGWSRNERRYDVKELAGRAHFCEGDDPGKVGPSCGKVWPFRVRGWVPTVKARRWPKSETVKACARCQKLHPDVPMVVSS